MCSHIAAPVGRGLKNTKKKQRNCPPLLFCLCVSLLYVKQFADDADDNASNNTK